MLKNKFLAALVGFVAALGLAGGLALAQTSNTTANVYAGFNPLTYLTGAPGIPVAVGPIPTISGAGCGTLATVQASAVGGTSIFQFTANATSCTLTFTIPPQPAVSAGGTGAPTPVQNGLYCVATDETTPADSIKQSAHTTTTCVLTGTVVSGDKILVEVNGF
jgi:hypothetical protein